MISVRKLLTFGGYAALGPITGPLVAGVIRNARQGDYVLAGLYVAAIPSAWLLLTLALEVTSRALWVQWT